MPALTRVVLVGTQVGTAIVPPGIKWLLLDKYTTS